MISKIIKRSSLLALALTAGFSINASQAIRTRMLQVVVNPAAQGFQYTINNGTVVNGSSIINATNLVSTTNGGLVTPLTLNTGSMSTLRGLIYPAGTVNPSQANFNVSANGTPLTQQNSIGTFTQQADAVTPITFTTTPTNGNTFPAAGTLAQDVEWIFNFNGNGCCPQNNGNRVSTIVAEGQLVAGNFGSNQVAFMGMNMPAQQAGANGPDLNQINNARVYFSQDLTNPQMLIEVELANNIRV